MSEDELKLNFDRFASKFEESIFTLISKFAEINESMSRVQEGLDFLGKLRIQTAENKQLMTKVEKAFKNLERKLRDMSVDGFEIPESPGLESMTAEGSEDLDSFFSATVEDDKEEKEKVKDLEEFGSSEELPSVDDILASEPKKTVIDTPKPPEIKPPEPSHIPNAEKVEVSPENLSNESSPKLAPKPVPEKLEPEPEPEPIGVKPEPEPIGLEPEPEPPSETPKPITAPKQEYVEETPKLTPTPKLEKESITPAPKVPAKLAPKLEAPKLTAPKLHAPKAPSSMKKVVDESGLTPVPKPPAEEEVERQKEVAASHSESAEQKVANVMGPQDVWHNLIIDVKNAKSNEQMALSLGNANDQLKHFIRFHKVLFELLKTASAIRKAGTQNEPTQEEREVLLKQIDAWKFELR